MKERGKNIPEQLVLKKETVNYYELIILCVALGVLVYFIDGTLIPFVSFVVTVVLGYRAVARLKDREPKILIDKRGIEIVKRKKLYYWDEVKYAFLKYQSEGTGQNSRSVAYLFIEAKSISQSFKIDDYKFSRKLLKETIEHYSGRDIGDETDKKKSEIARFLRHPEGASEIIQIFSKWVVWRTLWPAITYVLVIVGFGFLHFQMSNRFVFAIGSLVAFLLSVFCFQLIKKQLLGKNVIRNLTSEELTDVYKYYGFTRKLMITEQRFVIGFCTVLTIIFFVVAY